MTYYDGIDSMACTKCGNRWYEVVKINLKTIPQEVARASKKKTRDRHKPRPCVNCERVKRIACKGLCCGCYRVVNDGKLIQ